jgi:lipopolysaccharide heptosyltransferase III
MNPLRLPPRPRILVVALRRLGDVLFATPVMASLRGAFPQAVIDALVFDDTAGILAGNPDIDRVIAMPARPTGRQGLALALRLARRYDLAVSTQSGDRPIAFALLAGRRHVGPIDGGRRGALRRLALSRSVAPLPGEHRLEAMLRLVDAIGIARIGRLVPPGSAASATGASTNPGVPYAVVHAAPMFVYKRWTAAGWRALAAGLRERGLKVCATGGADPAERAYLADVWATAPEVVRLDGQLSWPELAALLRGARAFIGPDTSVTHVAAATGCPTIALYGPTDPRLWGPVPAAGFDAAGAPMWAAAGTIQRRHNVWLVQNPLPCLPCQGEGCERHTGSFSRCLDELSPAQVLRAVDAALEHDPEKLQTFRTRSFSKSTR